MKNRHYNSRYERLQARRSFVPGPTRKSSHSHKCSCNRVWYCKVPDCILATKHKCIQCIKREQELNSGEQQKIDFEPKITYTYAHYSDFMTFTEMVADPVYISKEVVEAAMKQLAAVDWKNIDDWVKQ